MAALVAAASFAGAAPADDAVPPSMVSIAGGVFRMGAEGAEPNERPVHEVELAPFRIDRTEVTVGAARACVTRGVCRAPEGRSPACTFATGSPDQPVNCVDWAWADTFCRARGARLPTEAEWERAAGGGGPASYPWGREKPTCDRAVLAKGNHSAESCAARGPLPVGSRPRGATPSGLVDMAGNVEEWVADWYADRHPDGRARDPRGPGWGNARVLRGGGWRSRPDEARVTARDWAAPSEAGPNVGFRCAAPG